MSALPDGTTPGPVAAVRARAATGRRGDGAARELTGGDRAVSRSQTLDMAFTRVRRWSAGLQVSAGGRYDVLELMALDLELL